MEQLSTDSAQPTLLFCFSWPMKSKLISLVKLTPKISIPTCRTSLSTFPRTVSVLWSSQLLVFLSERWISKGCFWTSFSCLPQSLSHSGTETCQCVGTHAYFSVVFFFLFILAAGLTECYHTSLLTHQLVIHIYSSANKDCVHYIFIHITDCVINVSNSFPHPHS